MLGIARFTAAGGDTRAPATLFAGTRGPANGYTAERRLLIAATIPRTVRGFLLPYADHFRRQGWAVDVLTAPGEGLSDLEGHFDNVHAVRWSRRPTDPGNLTSAYTAVRRLLRRGRYDIVHTHTPIASQIVRLAVVGYRQRPAIVYTAHGFHFHPRGGVKNVAFRAAERLAGHWTDRLVVINDIDANEARARRIVPGHSLVQHPGIGLDLEWFRPGAPVAAAASRFRTDAGLGEDDVLFSVIAELIPRKNHETVIRALARNGNPRYRLCLAGDGPERGRLELLARTLGIAERVVFLGVLTDVRPLMAASRATVLLSHQEGLSRAVMESLAMGVPVLGSAVRGIAELITPGGGIVVEPRDVAGAAAALDRIADFSRGEQLREKLSAQLDDLSIGRLLELHESLYDGLLTDRQSAASCLRQ